jgi:tetratricopeptide (TPR) repeat protein
MEVVLAVTGVSSKECARARGRFPDWRIVCRKKQLRAGPARNLAAERSSQDAEVISFFDADDEMRPNRLEIIWSRFVQDPLLSVVTHYYTSPSVTPNRGTASPAWPEFERPIPSARTMDGDDLVKTFVYRVQKTGEMFGMTRLGHGHVSVRRRVIVSCCGESSMGKTVRFGNAAKDEDIRFLYDVLVMLQAEDAEAGRGSASQMKRRALHLDVALARYMPRPKRKRGVYKEWEQHLERAQEERIDLPQTRGGINYSVGRYAEAFAHYDAAARENPSSSLFRYQSGFALYHLARWAETSERFERALQLDEIDGALTTGGLVGNTIEPLQDAINHMVGSRFGPIIDAARVAITRAKRRLEAAKLLKKRPLEVGETCEALDLEGRARWRPAVVMEPNPNAPAADRGKFVTVRWKGMGGQMSDVPLRRARRPLADTVSEQRFRDDLRNLPNIGVEKEDDVDRVERAKAPLSPPALPRSEILSRLESLPPNGLPLLKVGDICEAFDQSKGAWASAKILEPNPHPSGIPTASPPGSFYTVEWEDGLSTNVKSSLVRLKKRAESVSNANQTLQRVD